MSLYLFLVFLIAILITRVFLFLRSIPSPTIGTFRIHHWMYGVVLILIGLLTRQMVVFAIGLGLFVDELAFILIGGKNHEDNYSKISLVGTAVFIAAVFFLKDYLVLPFM